MLVKVMEKQYVFKKLKGKKITDESETGFNFSRNEEKHAFFAL